LTELRVIYTTGGQWGKLTASHMVLSRFVKTNHES